MDKKYLAKIIATDNEGLQMISACASGGKVKISEIKYLSSNKVFLLSIERNKIETNEEDKKIKYIIEELTQDGSTPQVYAGYGDEYKIEDLESLRY